MDFSLGEDRQMMADALGRFFAGTFDWKCREAAIGSAEGWSRDLWAQLAELGAIGALFDEASGGHGGSPFDIGVVFQEVGKVLAVTPLLSTLIAGRMLAAAGRTDIIEKMVTGKTLVTAALDGAVPVQAREDAGGWTLVGGMSVVPFAADADLFLVVAADSTFLVEMAATGVRIEAYPLVDGGVAGEVFFDATPATLVGEAGLAGPVIEAAVAAGLVALSWEAVAIMDVLRDRTLDHLRTRRQFGVAIGKFQALQHRMATLALEIEQARSAAINAAARFGDDRIVRERSVSAAKVTIGRVGSLAAEEAIQLHGGIGMTWELPLSHYAKRLVMIGHQLGDEDDHLERFIALGHEMAPTQSGVA